MDLPVGTSNVFYIERPVRGIVTVLEGFISALSSEVTRVATNVYAIEAAEPSEV